MNDQNMNNYHWTSMNVSEWAKNQISHKLESLGYKVVDPKIQAYINNRMNKLNLVYFYTFKAERGDKWLRLNEFDGYCELDDILGNDKDDLKSFFGFLKEMEITAIEAFKNKQHTNPEKNIGEYGEQYIKLNSIDHIKENDVFPSQNDNFVGLNLEFQANFSENELINFLTNPSFIAAWSLSQFAISGTQIVLFDKAVFDSWNQKKNNFRFKMSDWDGWSDAKIETRDKNICIHFNRVPCRQKDVVTNFWYGGILNNICKSLGFTFKNIE